MHRGEGPRQELVSAEEVFGSLPWETIHDSVKRSLLVSDLEEGDVTHFSHGAVRIQ